MNSKTGKSSGHRWRRRDFGDQVEKLLMAAGLLFWLMFAIFVVGVGFYLAVDLALAV